VSRLREVAERARDREVLARIIDPVAWAGTDDFAANPPKDSDDPRLFDRWVMDGTAPSLAKADAIIALQPDLLALLDVLGEVERALKAARHVCRDASKDTYMDVPEALFDQIDAAILRIRSLNDD
jgi:hypothetical protein